MLGLKLNHVSKGGSWGLLAGVNTPILISLLAWAATATTTQQTARFRGGGPTPREMQGVPRFMAKLT